MYQPVFCLFRARYFSLAAAILSSLLICTGASTIASVGVSGAGRLAETMGEGA